MRIDTQAGKSGTARGLVQKSEKEILPAASRVAILNTDEREVILSGECRCGNPFERTDVLTIDQVLAAARARLRRLSPDEAYEAMVKTGAILVDTRPEGQRAIEGSIAGALVVERNVLEWRLDPASSARLPAATDHDIHVIVFCSEGYSSSLAAISLQDVGLHRATDMIGGFLEWKATGLPIVPPSKTC